MTLVTHQTGPEGRVVQRLLIEETLPIERELYLGIVLDRAHGKTVFMASAAGGMEIEEVAAKTPERILKEAHRAGLRPARRFRRASWPSASAFPAPASTRPRTAMMALAKAYDALDASLAEINPFILTKDGKVYALDAKINLDDNALFRHKDLLELRDLNEEDPLEVEASQLRPELHQARRQRRLHGERRGPRHGHHGHHQVRRRQPRELPGCRRRRERRADQERLPHSALRPRREGGADQHLRRHPALRHAGHRRGRRGARAERQGAHRGSHGRHQRRAGPQDPEGFRLQLHRRRRHERRRGESGERCEGSAA